MRVQCFLLGTLLLLSGCILKPVAFERPSNKKFAVVDDTPALAATTKRCEQDDALGKLTRSGCLRGEEFVQEYRPYATKEFDSIPECIKKIKKFEVDEHVESLLLMCRKEWKHLYKRKGCYAAIRAYYDVWDEALCVNTTALEQERKEK